MDDFDWRGGIKITDEIEGVSSDRGITHEVARLNDHSCSTNVRREEAIRCGGQFEDPVVVGCVAIYKIKS